MLWNLGTLSLNFLEQTSEVPWGVWQHHHCGAGVGGQTVRSKGMEGPFSLPERDFECKSVSTVRWVCHSCPIS